MEQFGSYPLIIGASLIIIASFLFSEIAKRTNVPSVLLLILLGMGIKLGLDAWGTAPIDLSYPLELFGIVGLIMIVLEAALELKLDRDKLLPIGRAFGLAAVGLLLSTWIAAEILEAAIDGMTTQSAWLYATPLSILSSAIIIPSVGGLRRDKKEFHIYESTFSDILGIIVFYFLTGPFEGGGEDLGEHAGTGAGEVAAEAASAGHGLLEYGGILLATVVIAVLASYALVLVFQTLKSHVKLFLLIAVLLLEYAIGKTYHLSSLIIILVFGLMFANIDLLPRVLRRPIKPAKVREIYEGLHVVTLETAFLVRTFFFVIFGLTIDPSSLLSVEVVSISSLIIASIFLVRFALLRLAVGRDLFPQVFVAPRGLITVLLYNAIPGGALVAGFQPGILLFVIIGTSLIMTFAMIRDKNRAGAAVRAAEAEPVDLAVWEAPSLHAVAQKEELSA